MVLVFCVGWLVRRTGFLHPQRITFRNTCHHVLKFWINNGYWSFRSSIFWSDSSSWDSNWSQLIFFPPGVVSAIIIVTSPWIRFSDSEQRPFKIAFLVLWTSSSIFRAILLSICWVISDTLSLATLFCSVLSHWKLSVSEVPKSWVLLWRAFLLEALLDIEYIDSNSTVYYNFNVER